MQQPAVVLRPITLFGNSHLSVILSSFNSYVTISSEEFVHFVRKQKDEILVSFDVVSVFLMNIPANLVDVTTKRQLQDQSLEDRTTLDVDDILMFCVKTT